MPSNPSEIAGQGPRFAQTLEAQSGRLIAFVPVFLGLGIGGYLALPFAPGPGALGAASVTALVLTAFIWPRRYGFGVLLFAPVLILIGAVLIGVRAERLAAPVLDFHYYGPIEGRIMKVDRSASNAVRITLDQVRLDSRTQPQNVRLSLFGDIEVVPVPGLRVMTTGHLGAPGGPVEPGGFDFRRQAWFDQLGGVGWTRTPLLRHSGEPEGYPLGRFRMTLSERIQTTLPGPTGGVAAALITGDRAGLDPNVVEALRATNLAHLLAISGLHMGLVAGLIYFALFKGLAMLPYVALNLRTDKIAAAGSLIAATVYMAMSGGSIATERAYIMTLVALSAVFFDRQALSIRTVALAATIILIRKPEALVTPGFQMSFAATLALIASFRDIGRRGYLPSGVWRGPAALLLSAFVAGLATLPFAAGHFNRIPSYGLIANLLSTPLMGTVVMPAGIAAMLLAPLGLDWLPLWVMGKGIAWIIFVAETVASWPHSVRGVIAPPALAVALIGFGGVQLLVWSGPGRLFGGGLIALALVLWSIAERPPILVSDTGKLIGVMTPEGRVLNRARGEGFVANIWLENDGDLVTQEQAAARQWPSNILVDPGAEDECREEALYLLREIPEGFACRAILIGEEAMAIWPSTGRVLRASQVTGVRPWATQ